MTIRTYTNYMRYINKAATGDPNIMPDWIESPTCPICGESLEPHQAVGMATKPNENGKFRVTHYTCLPEPRPDFTYQLS